MLTEEQQLIACLRRLADCLLHDAYWPELLKQAAVEAEALFQRDADVSRRFEFVSSHNYSVGGMGSLNEAVPDACEPYHTNLYKATNDLLRVYWKGLGREWHDYSKFDLIPEGARVRLVPGRVDYLNSVYATEVPQTEGAAEEPWTVIHCEGPDITNMPRYTIRRANTFRSARQEALEVVKRRKSLLERACGGRAI